MERWGISCYNTASIKKVKYKNDKLYILDPCILLVFHAIPI